MPDIQFIPNARILLRRAGFSPTEKTRPLRFVLPLKGPDMYASIGLDSIALTLEGLNESSGGYVVKNAEDLSRMIYQLGFDYAAHVAQTSLARALESPESV